ncbi:MAG: hypothetical protein QOC98_2432 [Frankiaceae bacterium]|nr:hypothetical protein [Frankiaceae bacterium]
MFAARLLWYGGSTFSITCSRPGFKIDGPRPTLASDELRLCIGRATVTAARWKTAAVAYDSDLADRIRAVVGGEPGLAEKRMFGGLAFLIDGHLAVSANSRGDMLVRCDPAETEQLAEHPAVEPYVMRGKPMTGWLDVGSAAIAEDSDLEGWVAVGVRYARSLGPA